MFFLLLYLFFFSRIIFVLIYGLFCARIFKKTQWKVQEMKAGHKKGVS